MTECVIRGERTPSCARPADVGVCSPECAIRYEGVSFSYKPGVPFMEGLSAAIPAGAVTSIVGPNGCGKSTLVKLAAGLLRPVEGRVEVAGHDTGELASRERAHLMAVLAQSSRVPPMTVEALVACGRHPHLGWGGRLGPDDRAAVEAAMERAGVARFRSHDLHQQQYSRDQSQPERLVFDTDAPVDIHVYSSFVEWFAGQPGPCSRI